MTPNTPLLEVDNLKQHFVTRKRWFRAPQIAKAVDGVSLSIQSGETLGLVGESGCGKSTLGRSILRLYEPTSGTIRFNGVDITHQSQNSLRPLRRQMQIIFQDPYASLNPRMTIQRIIEEPLIIHGLFQAKQERADRIKELLSLVGLRFDLANRYPHELSGGQRQRVGIARALAVEPKLIVCDEPVSALDVSIQGQIINLLKDLQEHLKLTYLFIAHDLAVVRHISDRVAVMYLGQIVEMGPAEKIYQNPLHPYTQALLSAAPIPDPKAKKNRIALTGDLPSPLNPPGGCRFHTRCPKAMALCQNTTPPLIDIDSDRQAACLLYANQ